MVPFFVGGTTTTRLLLCLLLHPVLLEGAEAIGRSASVDKVASQLRRGVITLAQAEQKIIQSSLVLFPIKQFMLARLYSKNVARMSHAAFGLNCVPKFCCRFLRGKGGVLERAPDHPDHPKPSCN